MTAARAVQRVREISEQQSWGELAVRRQNAAVRIMGCGPLIIGIGRPERTDAGIFAHGTGFDPAREAALTAQTYPAGRRTNALHRTGAMRSSSGRRSRCLSPRCLCGTRCHSTAPVCELEPLGGFEIYAQIRIHSRHRRICLGGICYRGGWSGSSCHEESLQRKASRAAVLYSPRCCDSLRRGSIRSCSLCPVEFYWLFSDVCGWHHLKRIQQAEFICWKATDYMRDHPPNKSRACVKTPARGE